MCWDANLGPQDGSQIWIHKTMMATMGLGWIPERLLVFLAIGLASLNVTGTDEKEEDQTPLCLSLSLSLSLSRKKCFSKSVEKLFKNVYKEISSSCIYESSCLEMEFKASVTLVVGCSDCHRGLGCCNNWKLFYFCLQRTMPVIANSQIVWMRLK